MANTKTEDSVHNGKEASVTKSGTTLGTTRVKVQWPKSCSKVFPSCRNTQRQPVVITCNENTHDDIAAAKQENENQNKRTPKQDVDKATNSVQEHEKKNEKTQRDCSSERTNQQDLATVARLRAQRRWRMGLLKRSKFGGIGEAGVSDLFPDYFPPPFAIEEDRSEDDDILTSLKESKQRHRAKLLKQNSIDKIDRELGDRETKLIAGSWLQIYS